MLTLMSKVEVIGSKKHYQETIDRLQAWGKLHVERVAELGESNFIQPLLLDADERREKEARDELKKILDDVTSHIPQEVLHTLRSQDRFSWVKEEVEKLSLEEALQKGRDLQNQFLPRVRKKGQLQDELSVTRAYEEVLNALMPALSKQQVKRGWSFLGATVDRRYKEVLSQLEEELKKITNNDYVFCCEELRRSKVAIIMGFGGKYSEAVHTLLWGEGISELRTPSELKGKPFSEAFPILQQRLKELPAELERVNKGIKEFFQEHGAKLLLLKALNLDELSQFEVAGSLATSRYTFILKAWVPSGEVKALKGLLSSHFKGDVIVNEVWVPEERAEETPVALSNPRIIGAFEKLVSFFSLPKYGTIDPTPLVSLFFPIFFGFILGDVGYGGVLLLLGIFLYIKFRGNRPFEDVALVTVILSAYSIFFGFLFGEFFGVRQWFPPLLPALARGHLDKSEVVMNYLLVSIAFGVIQVVYGLLLGVYINYKRHHTKHAIEGIAKLTTLIGIGLVLGKLMEVIPPVSFYLGLGVLGLSLPLLTWAGGAVATLEITSLITNILSYVRLMAIGMAAVAFTMVADTFKEMVSSPVLAVVVVVGIHTFNMILHVFTPTIQSLRLHYVEFFTKFFVPGGRAYQPFRRIGGETT
jgi:V/A-type H+-transporting ATPase subunit I